MNTFVDCGGQVIKYEFRYETLNEDTDEKEFTCYIKPHGEWHPMGGGKTKETALKQAVKEWNYWECESRI
jgi:hypothetical protein